MIDRNYEVVVVGGGLSGICAAIAAARHGAKTALVHERPVLGGNASSEIRMHICGADCGGMRENARETGLIEEIILENKKRNVQQSFSVFDTVLWEKVRFQKGLDLYLNTTMIDASKEDDSIKGIYAYQMTTGKQFNITGSIFIDATGDANLAVKAGANYMTGREGKDMYNESNAPPIADNHTMGSSLMYKAVDTGRKTAFEKPFWAYTFKEDDLIHRRHSSYESDMELYNIDSGFWWVELGGDMDTVNDAEEIRDELLKSIYGIWDHIKNGGDHGADNFALDWVQFLPGKRESRRIKGDHVLNANDLTDGRIFADAVAYGGWPMDIHPPGGLKSSEEPTNFIKLNSIYTIPYRCYCSNNVQNLMMAGRNISASHLAFGSVRVMGTCATGGQAVGTAAAMAIRNGYLPRDVLSDINELQQILLRDDCYIPGILNKDEDDHARSAIIEASSFFVGHDPKKVINGVSRNTGNDINCWISNGIKKSGETITCSFTEPVYISEIHIKFDSDLSHSRNLILSLDKAIRDTQTHNMPKQLVKDYDISITCFDKTVYICSVRENYQRFKKHILPEKILADKVLIRIYSTYGDKNARVFEIRIY